MIQGMLAPATAVYRHPGRDPADPAGGPRTGTADPAALDRMAALAGRLLAAPMAFVSVADPTGQRQLIRGRAGLTGRWAERPSVPRALAFCERVRQSDLPLVIDDTRHDPRGRGFPVLVDLGVAAYLGAPVHDREGRAIGTLSVIDPLPRRWAAEDAALLAALAATVDDLLSAPPAAPDLVAAAAAAERGLLAEALDRDLSAQARAFLGVADRVTDLPQAPTRAEAAAAIRQTGEAFRAIAGELRELGAIATGRAQSGPETLRPDDLADAVLPGHRLTARIRGMRLAVGVDGDPARPRRGDAVRAAQVFDRFLRRALRGLPGGGDSVALQLDCGHPDWLTIRLVTPGAPGDRRAEDTAVRISDLLLDAQLAFIGGRLSVEATETGGTLARLDLPLPLDDAAEPAGPDRATTPTAAGDDPDDLAEMHGAETGPAEADQPGVAAGPLAGRRLLIAETTPTIRKLLAVLAARAGAVVTLAEDAPAAAAAYAAAPQDLALIDLALPQGGGIAVLHAIRAEAAARGLPPPVAIGIAAGGRDAALPPARAAGFALCLRRPIDAAGIVTDLARLARCAACGGAGGAGPVAAAE